MNTEADKTVDVPKHIAIIMDGNGRWAKQKLLNRIKGHREGAKALREAITACMENGVQFLTVYAFSTENWNRPKQEVDALMELLREFIDKELDSFIENKIRLKTIGRIHELPQDIQEKIKQAEEKTADDPAFTFVLALNYGSRGEITDAVNKIIKSGIQEINEENFSEFLYTKDIPDPELLIRTSGELRLSNFLLWQLSYAEFYFTDILWPDFKKKHLVEAIEEYKKRNRRFGKI